MLDIIKDDIILVCPFDVKEKILMELNKSNKLYNTKFFTFEEIEEKLFFSYDEKSIYYLISKYNYSYDYSTIILNNLKYLLLDKYEDNRLSKLLDIKNDLINNNLLYFDKYFFNEKKNIVIYGYTLLDKWKLKVIDILKENNIVNIINNDINNYKHDIYEFNNIIEEIEFIANDIINKELDINHVFISGINNDNKYVIKRVFDNYNININFNNNNILYYNNYALEYLNDFNIDNVKDIDIKNTIIDVINKYSFISDLRSIKSILINEFKNTKIKSKKYKNAVNEVNLKDNIINDNDYIYLVGFNREYIPTVYKDEDLISDNIKFDYMSKTYEKNNDESNKWNIILRNIKNLTITYSLQDLKNSLHKCTLINKKPIKGKLTYSNYSNKSNIFNLSIMLDNYRNFNVINEDVYKLLNTYKDINYLTYSNKYKKVNTNNDNLQLSYSKINTYFECPFKYYLTYILKLDPYQNTFDTYLGSLCHYILSNIFNESFSFEKTKEEFEKDNEFELTNENKVFKEKVLKELNIAIDNIKEQLKGSKYDEIYTEKEIETNIDGIKFKGIIDKIMKYEDKVVLIDYKTGNTDIDLSLCKEGLNLQLPVYIYLIKSIYPDSKIVGIYLQKILLPILNYQDKKTKEDLINDALKLYGYSIDDEYELEEFDNTYSTGKFIKGIGLTSNGFRKDAKVLSNEDFNKLSIYTEEKIKEVIKKIKNNEFDIEPKILDNKNKSCEYCKFKSICFACREDEKEIHKDKELTYLRGEEKNNKGGFYE